MLVIMLFVNGTPHNAQPGRGACGFGEEMQGDPDAPTAAAAGERWRLNRIGRMTPPRLAAPWESWRKLSEKWRNA